MLSFKFCAAFDEKVLCSGVSCPAITKSAAKRNTSTQAPALFKVCPTLQAGLAAVVATMAADDAGTAFVTLSVTVTVVTLPVAVSAVDSSAEPSSPDPSACRLLRDFAANQSTALTSKDISFAYFEESPSAADFPSLTSYSITSQREPVKPGLQTHAFIIRKPPSRLQSVKTKQTDVGMGCWNRYSPLTNVFHQLHKELIAGSAAVKLRATLASAVFLLHKAPAGRSRTAPVVTNCTDRQSTVTWGRKRKRLISNT